MINPHLMTPSYVKYSDRARRRKVYCAAFEAHGQTRRCRHAFKTALRARQHALDVQRRWCRLYDAAIVAVIPAPMKKTWLQRLWGWIRNRWEYASEVRAIERLLRQRRQT